LQRGASNETRRNRREPCLVSDFLLSVCPADDKPMLPLAWEVTDGVQAPESAYFDAASGFVFVSNIGGGGPTDKDGDGYLSKWTPDGQVVAAKWISGLNSPKGIRSFRRPIVGQRYRPAGWR
jgi:hypothetical protein